MSSPGSHSCVKTDSPLVKLGHDVAGQTVPASRTGCCWCPQCRSILPLPADCLEKLLLPPSLSVQFWLKVQTGFLSPADQSAVLVNVPIMQKGGAAGALRIAIYIEPRRFIGL